VGVRGVERLLPVVRRGPDAVDRGADLTGQVVASAGRRGLDADSMQAGDDGTADVACRAEDGDAGQVRSPIFCSGRPA
jgi:hypothetical protein